MKKKFLFLLMLMPMGIINAESSYYERGELVELKKMYTQRGSDKGAIEYFRTDKGKKIGITDEILVECEAGVDCIALLNQFGLNDISKITDTIFVAKTKKFDDIFTISRGLFESKKVKFAHPNFVKERRLR